MQKDEFIHSLPNVKLIIGNGFDLHCGLRTSYHDYFSKKRVSYNGIIACYNVFSRANCIITSKFEKMIYASNIWDVFFAIETSRNVIGGDWYDIESLIASSLMRTDSEARAAGVSFGRSSIHWEEVRSLMSFSAASNNDRCCFLAKILKKKHRNSEHIGFYKLLLQELKEFEKSFGEFIYSQIKCIGHKNEFGTHTLNEKYLINVKQTILDLCGDKNEIYVDSFNYSEFLDDGLKVKVHHINGNFENPIFGIDTCFEPNDERFIFTKSWRRMNLDMLENKRDDDVLFENVIIYGHSMNKADFSYFFPIFDKLDLLDSHSGKMIIFAYSIYDKNKREGIESNIMQRSFNILHEYAKSKGINDSKRFIDSLTTQQRIITKEVPLNDFMYRNFLDEEWEEIDSNAESNPLLQLYDE